MNPLPKSVSNRFLLTLCFLLALSISFFAQKSTVKLRHITSEQGLSQSMVNCILQDRRGFVWFGTQDGLNRYDGNKIKVYSTDPDNPRSISGNFVSCMIEDSMGRVWIGSAN